MLVFSLPWWQLSMPSINKMFSFPGLDYNYHYVIRVALNFQRACILSDVSRILWCAWSRTRSYCMGNLVIHLLFVGCPLTTTWLVMFEAKVLHRHDLVFMVNTIIGLLLVDKYKEAIGRMVPVWRQVTGDAIHFSTFKISSSGQNCVLELCLVL